MSLITIVQFHTDLGKLALKNAQQFADPAMLTIFNANLNSAKSEYIDDDVLMAIPEAVGQVRIGDLLVRVGQLKSTMESYQSPLLAGA